MLHNPIRSHPFGRNVALVGCLFIISIMFFGNNLSISSTLSNPTTISTLEKHSPQSAEGTPVYNDTYTGVGGSLNYTLESAGFGNQSQIYCYKENNNITAVNPTVSVPLNAVVKELNMTISNLEKRNDSIYQINETLSYAANYTIDYTEITYLNNATWFNVSIIDSPEARVDLITITINDTLNESFSVSTNHSLNDYVVFSEECTAAISIAMFYENSTFFAMENFSVSCINATTGETYGNKKRDTYQFLNPYYRLNDATTPKKIAMNFTIPVNTNITYLDLYCRFNLIKTTFPFASYNLKVSILENNIEGLLISTYSFNQTSPILREAQLNAGWLSIPLSTSLNGIFLDAGEYYLIIDGSSITNNADQHFFDVFTTSQPRTQSQNDSVWNGVEWVNMNANVLFRIQTAHYQATDLNEVGLSVSSTTAPIITSNFDPATNFTFLNNNQGWASTVGQFPIQFNSSWGCRFDFNYTVLMQVNGQTVYLSCNNSYQSPRIAWNTSVIVARPTVNQDETFFPAYNYTVHFPSDWFDINATSTDQYATTATTELAINQSVSNLEWILYGSSTAIPVKISGDREDYARGLSVTITATFQSLQYNNSLSFWNGTEFLDYNINHSRGITNGSYIDVFPAYNLSSTYNNTKFSVRLWWNNNTAAGWVWQDFIVKIGSTVNKTIEFGEMKANTNATYGFTYRSILNQSITGATLNVTNWVDGNWSYLYEDEIYVVNFFAYNLVPGYRDIMVKFNHTEYMTENITFRIYITCNTSMSLVSGDLNVYFGQNFDLYLALYSSTGERVFFANDDDVQFTFLLDGQSYPSLYSEFYTHPSAAFPNSNLHGIIKTIEFLNANFLGLHSCTVRFSKVNNTIRYEAQEYTFYFTVYAIPSYLTLNATSVSYPGAIWNEFNGNPNNLSVTMKYQFNRTREDSLDTATDYLSGSLWGKIFDLTENISITPWIALKYIGSGLYQIDFNTYALSLSHDYKIQIIANTTNFVYQEWNQRLNLISKWETKITVTKIITVTEGKVLYVAGRVMFSNESNDWAAAHVWVNITYVQYDANHINTTSVLVRTDGQGYFNDSTLIAKDYFQYSIINISVTVQDSVQHLSSKFDPYQSKIQYDWITRLLFPFLIIAAVVIVVVPILRFSIPILREKVPKTKFYKTLLKHPVVKSMMAKMEKKNFATTSDNQEITLRIPKLTINDDSTSSVNTVISPEFETIKLTPEEPKSIKHPAIGGKLQVFFDKTRANLQEMLGMDAEIPDLIGRKENSLIDAVQLEIIGKHYSAAFNFYYARFYALKLNQYEDAEIIAKRLKETIGKLTPAEQSNFKKKIKTINKQLNIKELLI